jgi:hypothetical protein
MAAATANRRLTYIVKRQLSWSVSMPPSSKPIDAPLPAIAPYRPKAFARSLASVNVVVSSDRAAGASSAPKAPWTARAPTSMPKLVAAPPTAEAEAKPSRPMMNVHLRPNRSLIRPPSSSRLPKDNAYAVTIHWRLSFVKCSAFCAEGSAMLTTVASSTTISWAIPRIARIAQRRE